MSNTAGVSQLTFFKSTRTCGVCFYVTLTVGTSTTLAFPKQTEPFPVNMKCVCWALSFLISSIMFPPSFMCPYRLLTWGCIRCKQLATTSAALCVRTACPLSCPPTADFLFPVLPICSSSIPKSICFSYYRHIFFLCCLCWREQAACVSL